MLLFYSAVWIVSIFMVVTVSDSQQSNSTDSTAIRLWDKLNKQKLNSSSNSAKAKSKGAELACPPIEYVWPCRCVEHRYGQYSQTLLACNSTDFSKNERNFEQVLHRITKRLGSKRSKYFDWLQLVNMDGVRKISRNFFAGLRFKNLVIENGPQLRQIHPSAFKLVVNLLRYVYAYNTRLELYRWNPMKAPFGTLRNLTEVHIASKRNICPPKELIFPCECNIRQNPLQPFRIKRQVLQLRCMGYRGKTYNVSRIFNRLTKLVKNANYSMWYFDEIFLRNVTELGERAFGEVNFSELYIEDSEHLSHISRNTFMPNTTVQKLRISGVNFASETLGETFEAINQLNILRSLYIWSSNFDFVPEYAFANLQAYLKEIVLYGNNIKAIGSYAFANLPNLEQLRIDGNNLLLVDKYAFATNYSSNQPLQVTLVANNLRDTTFAFMSMSGAQRPLHISFAEMGGCYWDLQYLDESIFAPFLDKSANRLYLEPECQLKCNDCRMRWLTEMPKHAQRRVTLLPEHSSQQNFRRQTNVTDIGSGGGGYVPCEGGVNLFDIYENLDWENCN